MTNYLPRKFGCPYSLSNYFRSRPMAFLNTIEKKSMSVKSFTLFLRLFHVQRVDMANISAPKKSFADETIAIKVSGLHKNQKITIQAQQVSDRDQTFHSFAHYVADDRGEVNLDSNHAFGGSYTGVEKMGLFWSMKRPLSAGKSYGTLTKTKLSTPSNITVSVFDGNLNEPIIWDTTPIVSTNIERWFNDSSVDRLPVTDSIITGTLFIPRGPGPYPALLDIDGARGGILEYRAALLANHGFATLALGLFNCENRPKEVKCTDMEYIGDAIQYLSNHDKVLNHGVGVIGLSLGGTLALATAACFPKIRCAVDITGPVFSCIGANIKYKDEFWKAAEVNNDDIVMTDGIQDHYNTHKSPSFENLDRYMPNFSDSKAALLLVFGGEDRIFRTNEIINLATEKFQAAKKTNYKILKYPGAGHLIYPPYQPHIKHTYYPLGPEFPTDFGGEMKQHAKAQEKAWKEILKFLNQHLNNNMV